MIAEESSHQVSAPSLTSAATAVVTPRSRPSTRSSAGAPQARRQTRPDSTPQAAPSTPTGCGRRRSHEIHTFGAKRATVRASTLILPGVDLGIWRTRLNRASTTLGRSWCSRSPSATTWCCPTWCCRTEPERPGMSASVSRSAATHSCREWVGWLRERFSAWASRIAVALVGAMDGAIRCVKTSARVASGGSWLTCFSASHPPASARLLGGWVRG